MNKRAFIGFLKLLQLMGKKKNKFPLLSCNFWKEFQIENNLKYWHIIIESKVPIIIHKSFGNFSPLHQMDGHQTEHKLVKK